MTNRKAEAMNEHLAIHRDREEWVRRYGEDTDWIAPTQDKLAHLLPAYRVDE